MKQSFPSAVTIFALTILVCCTHDNVAGPAPEPIAADSLFADIDTTLNIQQLQEGNLTLYSIDRYNTVVVKIPRISSYLFIEQPTRSLEQIAADSGFSLVVNASYFDYFYDDPATYTGRHFKNAGYLKIDGIVLQEVKIDRQLSRLFAYNSILNTVDYFSVNDLERTYPYDLVVQIGPQLIRDNVVDTAAIVASYNGMLPWPRTTFASVNGSELYIIVNMGFAGVTLTDLAVMLRSSGIFRKNLDVINFDGGFSTSLYIKDHPELSTQPTAVLPLLICVR